MGQKHFKVGTFNLYNLIAPNVLYYDSQQYSLEEYSKKTTWIARQLDRMQVDVVGFQELFDPTALGEALAQTERLAAAEVVCGKPSEKGPAVALASRLPVLSHQSFESFPAVALLDIEGIELPLKRFSRPVLSVTLKLQENLECTVFVVHLKSKRPLLPEGVDRHDPLEQAKGQARALIQRAAEVTALRVLLLEALQNRKQPVIVLGDVNDGGLAVTTQIIAGEPPWHKLKLEQRQKSWDVQLYRVQDIQTRQSYGNFYYTHIHNGHHEALDQIMVSQEFVAEHPGRVGHVTSVSVFNDHLVDETLTHDGIEPWQSDHGQVVASIKLAT
ncbi:MAG: endonuclease/exonuclease/phosphatase family protein [Verrucomicrobia bacterium]|nr:endonuclease/exonuclease/phosphatase family protein [Leptolyngbya sp. ES-bin-22]